MPYQPKMPLTEEAEELLQAFIENPELAGKAEEIRELARSMAANQLGKVATMRDVVQASQVLWLDAEFQKGASNE